MTGGPLRQVGVRRRLADRALDGRGRAVVSFRDTVLRVGRTQSRGKDVVPGPRGGGVRVLASNGVGEGRADLVHLIGVMLAFHAAKVLLQGLSEAVGENRRPIFAALSIPHDDAALIEVQVLHPKPEPFGEAKAASVQEVGDERVGPRVHGGEEAVCLSLREDRRETPGAVGPLNGANVAKGLIEDIVIEKDEGVEGLVLRGRRDVAPDGKVVEEGPHVCRAEAAGMRGVVKANVPDDPPAVAFFRMPAVLAAPARCVDLVE